MNDGLKETKEVLKFVIDLGEAFDKAMADKKFEMGEIALLIAPLMQIGAAFEGLDKVKDEIKNLDSAKLADLVAYAKDELDLESDKTEEVVEKALELGLTIYSFVNLFKKKEEVAV